MCIPSPGQGHRAPFCQPVWQRAPEVPQPGCHCRTHPKARFSTSAFRQGLLQKTSVCFPLWWPLRRVLGTQPPYSTPSLSPPIFCWAALTWTASSELPSKSCSSITSTALIKAPRPPSWYFLVVFFQSFSYLDTWPFIQHLSCWLTLIPLSVKTKY